jgi:hypothetical protein
MTTAKVNSNSSSNYESNKGSSYGKEKSSLEEKSIRKKQRTIGRDDEKLDENFTALFLLILLILVFRSITIWMNEKDLFIYFGFH